MILVSAPTYFLKRRIRAKLCQSTPRPISNDLLFVPIVQRIRFWSIWHGFEEAVAKQTSKSASEPKFAQDDSESEDESEDEEESKDCGERVQDCRGMVKSLCESCVAKCKEYAKVDDEDEEDEEDERKRSKRGRRGQKPRRKN